MCNHKLRKGKYTLYLKFKKRDVPNTHISAEIYRIPDLKSPCIPYTQKPWPTLIRDAETCLLGNLKFITTLGTPCKKRK